MKKICTLFCLFVIGNLLGQERLSNFEGGLVPQSAEYLGQYDDHLYYYDTRQKRTNIFKENLLDDILESELILSLDDQDSIDTDRIVLVDNKIVFEDFNSWQIYDVNTKEFVHFIHPDDYFLSDAVYSNGHGFMLFWDSIMQVDLSDGSIKTYPKQTNFEEEFFFNDEQNNVLVDSFAFVIEVDQNNNEQLFSSLNVFNGETELLHAFNTFDFFFDPIFDRGGFYLQVVNTLDETHKLYSFKSKKEGVELSIQELELPASESIDKVNDRYCYTTVSDFSTGENVQTLHLQDFESMEYKTLEYISDSDFRVVAVTNDGVYFHKDGIEFGLLNFEGESSIFLDNVDDYLLARSEYPYGEGFIDDEFLLISFRFEDLTIMSSLVNKDGVKILAEPFAREIVYDEVLEEEVIYMNVDDDRQQIAVVVDQELNRLHKNELAIKNGGSFTIVDEEASIIRGSGDEEGFTLFRVDEAYREAVFTENFPAFSTFLLNDELYFITKEDEENYLNRVDLDNSQLETIPINLNGNSSFTAFITYGGDDFSIISYGDFAGFKFASLTPEGDFLPIIDANTSNSYDFSLYSDPKLINGRLVSLVENSATGNMEIIMFGRTYEETKLLFEVMDPFDAFIGECIEGDEWSYVEFIDPFLLKKDGTILQDDLEKPYYFEGNFYFGDRIFSEEQEQFVDWNSDLSEVSFVNNGFAYDTRNSNLEVVNIETLEKTEIDFASSFFVKYFDINGKTAVVNFNSDKVLITDGTEVGTEILDAPYPFTSLSRNTDVIGENLIYVSFDSGFGNELVAFNLVTGDEKVFDINPGTYSSNPEALFANENDIYFIAFEPETGQQLYRLTENMILDVVSLDDNKIELNVYPNPTAEFISIDEEIAYEQVAIFSIDGSLMKLENRNTLINVEDLNQGTYFVKVINEGKIIGTSTFVKI